MAVYFINAVGTGFWKIGYTSNDRTGAKNRLGSLQTGCPFELKIHHIIYAADRDTEGWIHSNWSDRKMRGEWFSLSDYEVWETIKRYEPDCKLACPETTTTSGKSKMNPHDYYVRELNDALREKERQVRRLSKKTNELTLELRRVALAYNEAANALPDGKRPLSKTLEQKFIPSSMYIDGELVYILQAPA